MIFISKIIASYTFWLVFKIVENIQCILNDTHKGKPILKSNETYKSINMVIWVVGYSCQLLMRASYTQIKLNKKQKRTSSFQLQYFQVKSSTPICRISYLI